MERLPTARPRTDHRLWASGAVVLLLAILTSSIHAARRPEAPLPGSAVPVPAPAVSPQGAGTIPCGYCDGDGRIDEADLRRQAPRLNVPLGRCPACEGRGRH